MGTARLHQLRSKQLISTLFKTGHDFASLQLGLWMDGQYQSALDAVGFNHKKGAFGVGHGLGVVQKDKKVPLQE
jgi:hypothetical protein